jgi:hypothetical protein
MITKNYDRSAFHVFILTWQESLQTTCSYLEPAPSVQNISRWYPSFAYWYPKLSNRTDWRNKWPDKQTKCSTCFNAVVTCEFHRGEPSGDMTACSLVDIYRRFGRTTCIPPWICKEQVSPNLSHLSTVYQTKRSHISRVCKPTFQCGMLCSHDCD